MKNLIFLFLFSLIALSCGDNALDYREDFDQNQLYGIWEDVSSVPDYQPGQGQEPAFRSAKFAFYQDGTYKVLNNTSLLDIVKDGAWEYDAANQIIKFDENYFDTIPESDLSKKWNVEKTWEIVDFHDNILSVRYHIYRQEAYVFNPVTSQTDTIQGIDIRMYRELQKEQ